MVIPCNSNFFQPKLWITMATMVDVGNELTHLGPFWGCLILDGFIGVTGSEFRSPPGDPNMSFFLACAS